MKNELQKIGIVFLAGFFIYIGFEVIFRTITNFNGTVPPRGLLSMGILGGVLVVMLGYINEIPGLRRLPLWLHCIIGAVIITGLEWVTGLIVNVHLCWNVWDYKHLILSTPDGQINLFFSLIWLVLSPLAFWVDDELRYTYLFWKSGLFYDNKESRKLQFFVNTKQNFHVFKMRRNEVNE